VTESKGVVAMKTSLRLFVVVAMLGAVIVGTVLPAGAASKSTYYVSLGDSAAAGLQPIGYGQTHGYADQLFDLVRSQFTQLRLMKFGCSGETTESLISGIGNPYPCTYPSGSQLDEAAAFLRAHVGQVAFVTIDIGGNDALVPCWDPGTGVFDQACVEVELSDIQANLAYIIQTLHAVAPGVPIAGMSYWDFFLGYWVTGPDGQTLAQTDEQAIETLNDGLVSTYENEGAIVADVAGPAFFNTADFTDLVVTKEWGKVPVNVANDCTWTWFCAKSPHGPDIHPNTEGYGVIAAAFEAVLPI
jgi:lysophospholipase L1-like esterase